MYPIVFRINREDGFIERLVIVQEPGVYDEYIAGETLYHEEGSDNELNSKKHVYDTPESGKEYLKPAQLAGSKLIVHLLVSEHEIDREVERIKKQFKATLTPKRDRKKRKR